MNSFPFSRRRFTFALLAALGARHLIAADRPKLRAAILGHTGEGDYGHGFDVIFNDLPGLEVVALADPDEAGRTKAAEQSKAARQYADWRELLGKEKPQLVCLASRWTHERHAMGMAALRVGAHLITEKPFTTTLAEADELLTTADRAGLKIAVAHQMRLAPSIVNLKKAIGDGLLGDLLELRAWGKQDEARSGGEDMIVLGTHVFDLMRLFAGDVEFCTARVLQGGRELTHADARKVKERIGPIAGDEVTAQFGFTNGVNGTFTSRKRLREPVGHWGIELIGSKTSVRILCDVYPAVHVLKRGSWNAEGRTDQWQRFEGDPASVPAADRGFGPANRRLVEDWLDAIEKNREPVCSGLNATKSLEMVMAVYHAALSGGRVALPLKDRSHPLGA
ncbi:MAG TPA: Gfo/Idh/MocA family oxidoreductase [Chthoniobacteraceae bacterium]|jgi:predicted dehydrogenase|nr:Gfo/Idh/MocA family oxidoreductase [Chthoniobacteraceae bacterium]